ncbi:MAG: hypothetical protein ACMUEL_03175 [Flavobacteriales bacterium Tduv]
MRLKSFISHLFFILCLCSVQTLLLNQISFLGYINPYLYILFVLTYPAYESRFVLILLSFFMGWIIDYFMNTGGMHTFAITLTAYLKRDVLRFITGKNIITDDDFSLHEISFIKKCSYTFLLTLIHYFSFFLLELFKISNFETISSKTVLGAIFNTILSLIYLSFTEKNKS